MSSARPWMTIALALTLAGCTADTTTPSEPLDPPEAPEEPTPPVEDTAPPIEDTGGTPTDDTGCEANACGGCAELDETELGMPCGGCNAGEMACVDADTIACVEAPPAEACEPLPADALAWWPAESDATDIVGSHDGTPAGDVSYADGHVGSAFAIGAGGRVDLPDDGTFDFDGSEFSIETWVRVDAWPPAPNTVCPAYAPIFANAAYGYNLTVVNEGDVSFGKYIATDEGAGVSAASVLTLGQWHHIAAVHALDELSLYIDGVLASTVPLTDAGVYYSPSDAPAIGTRNCYVDTYTFLGRIDELTVYTRALDDAEISGICAADTFGKCP